MTAEATLAVKRVMSKDDHDEMREEKKSKMGGGGAEDGGAAAGQILERLALTEDAAAAQALMEEEEGDGEGVDGAAGADGFPDLHRGPVPVATISHPSHNASRASTTHSSLSDEGGASGSSGGSGGGEGSSPRLPPPPASAGAAHAMRREVSVDSSFGGRNGSIQSDPSSNTDQRNSAGNWGWFEDVHGHESAFLPDTSGAKEGGTPERGSEKKKKRGGLLHIGSELMQNVLQSIMEPQRHRGESPPPWLLFFSARGFHVWPKNASSKLVVSGIIWDPSVCLYDVIWGIANCDMVI
ncbi:hypothetical protein ACHAWF_016677 [Thalassiosira exigua]